MDMPPLPSSAHWLGDRHAAGDSGHEVDRTGCVLYFEQQSDCLEFMRWLTAQVAPEVDVPFGFVRKRVDL